MDSHQNDTPRLIYTLNRPHKGNEVIAMHGRSHETSSAGTLTLHGCLRRGA